MTRWGLGLGLLCGALANCAPRPATPTPPGASPLAAQIAAVEAAWAQALRAADTVALGRLLAPEFVFVPADPAQPTVRRLELLTLVASNWFVTDSIAWRDFAAQGTADSATATLTLWVRAIINGERAPDGETRLQDTWVRRAGRWQVTRRQELPHEHR